MIVKLLCALAALLLFPVIVLFIYIGALTIMAGNMLALAKCATFLFVMVMGEIICIAELTRNDV